MNQRIHTPWGQSQTVDELAPGILSVSTAGHGGIRMDDNRVKQFHKAFPSFTPFTGQTSRFLEEDCDMLLAFILWGDEMKWFGPENIKKFVGYCEAYNANGKTFNDGKNPDYYPIAEVKAVAAETIKRMKAKSPEQNL